MGCDGRMRGMNVGVMDGWIEERWGWMVTRIKKGVIDG